MSNDFISTHEIICPFCKTRQNGIVRNYDAQTKKACSNDATGHFIRPAIICVQCKAVLKDKDIAESIIPPTI